MKNGVYVVWDLQGGELIGVCNSERAAREKVLFFLIRETGYEDWEWKSFAQNNGFESVEEFQDAILKRSDYDDELQMLVEERPLED